MAKAVEVRNLTFAYQGCSFNALSKVSFDLEQGDTLLVVGESGCGKTTLLQHLKPAFMPIGNRASDCRITLCGKEAGEMSEEEQAFIVGYVGQLVNESCVTDKVWHEIAFGLESMGRSQEFIRRRVAEVTTFFGLENVFHEKTAELSGGQKQLVNIASVMAMEPEILLLDEPTSQLDPVSTEELFRMIKKIHDELGTTIIIAEHRLESIFAHATKVMLMDGGSVATIGTPQEVSIFLNERKMPIFKALPVAARMYFDLKNNCVGSDIYKDLFENSEPPLTVNEGRRFLERYVESAGIKHDKTETDNDAGAGMNGALGHKGKPEVALTADELWFRYNRNGRDVIKDCSIRLNKGKVTALLGGNGAGKSTLVYLLSKQLKPYLGKVKDSGTRAGVLCQEPKSMFSQKTVADELAYSIKKVHTDDAGSVQAEITDFFGLSDCLSRHPFDLSGGQQQKLALAKLVAEDCDILLIDEPGKGMDYAFKEKMGIYFKELAKKGKTILIVSHDIEFCAAYSDMCGLFFDGSVVCLEKTSDFFADNVFYTTAVRRMCSGIIDVVLYKELMEALGVGYIEDDRIGRNNVRGDSEESGRNNASGDSEESGRNNASGDSEESGCNNKCEEDDRNKQSNISTFSNMTGAKETGLKLIIPLIVFLVVMPLTIYLGHSYLHQRKYYFISLMIILEGIAAFMVGFDRGKPRLKEIMTIAVLSAISALSRAAFYMIPAVKPMAALTIISGVGLGGVQGFLVGALSMLVSDIFFGQGPWTPWQMFTMGLIGLISGLIFYRDGQTTMAEKKPRLILTVFGFLAVLIIYGGIMNPASVLMYQENVNLQMLAAAYIPGLPVDLIHATSTAVFLWLAAEPMLEKLERVEKK